MHAIDIERLHAFLAIHGEVPVGERVRRRDIGEPAEKKARRAVEHVVFQDSDGVGDGRR